MVSNIVNKSSNVGFQKIYIFQYHQYELQYPPHTVNISVNTFMY